MDYSKYKLSKEFNEKKNEYEKIIEQKTKECSNINNEISKLKKDIQNLEQYLMKEYVIGHYFSNCMKKIMRYLKNPELLDIEDEKENLNNIEENTINGIKEESNLRKI